MAKRLTQKQLKAFDWAALVAKLQTVAAELPAVATFVIEMINLFGGAPTPKNATDAGPAECGEQKELCDKACETLIAHALAQFELCKSVCGGGPCAVETK